jgi:hypothetical protein
MLTRVGVLGKPLCIALYKPETKLGGLTQMSRIMTKVANFIKRKLASFLMLHVWGITNLVKRGFWQVNF